MGETLIATSGYSYEDWRDVLYPAELPADGFLQYYALFFPFVELNFSYYAMPKPATMASMIARTPSTFRFSLKAHKSLTHEIGSGWREDARTLARAAGVLAEAGRLVAVLVQLPYRFHHTPDNRKYLAAVLAELSPLPVVVEFRNDEWGGERVYDELDRRGVGVAMVDRPDLPGLPAAAERVTGGIAYLRFHGRNADAWWNGDASSRYDYLYSREELEAIVPRLRRMAKEGALYVAFNNHAHGNAVKNAQELRELLGPR
ncbi:MAG: DUF72 domain-containing protein [Spirochaetales bacterium]|nr:DUF72 domain-containing protein [Spirochaetales bacterium]